MRSPVADHVAMGPDTRGYPFGSFPLPPDAPFLDPLGPLMAIATVTTTIRLTTGILIAPLRSAPVLAKTAATIDVMSDGRLELGVGVGWHEAEYQACGVDFHRRGAVLDDVIGACRALWGQPAATYRSDDGELRVAQQRPAPGPAAPARPLRRLRARPQRAAPRCGRRRLDHRHGSRTVGDRRRPRSDPCGPTSSRARQFPVPRSRRFRALHRCTRSSRCRRDARFRPGAGRRRCHRRAVPDAQFRIRRCTRTPRARALGRRVVRSVANS